MSILLIAFSPVARSQGLSFSTATPTPASSATEGNPFAKLARPPRKPIPLRWKIAIVLVALLIASAALWVSLRAWRSSNLFDRQYRFPTVETVDLRLGANKSGGHMAAITFRSRAGPGQ